MRVIAGLHKGRRLKPPTWEGLRPTSDKLRETLFNILAPRVAGSRFLDGFAGTGAVGIEALSRGALDVTFVEHDRRAQALIAENLAHCGIENGCVIIRASFARAMEMLRQHPPFDIIVLDPPYDQPVDRLLAAAGERLADEGILVLEHGRRLDVPRTAGRLLLAREVRGGNSALGFYEIGA